MAHNLKFSLIPLSKREFFSIIKNRGCNANQIFYLRLNFNRSNSESLSIVLGFYFTGKVKLEYIDNTGFIRRKITSRRRQGGESGQPSHVYTEIDKRDNEETIKNHTVFEQNENEDWVRLHKDIEKFKAKKRPQKRKE